MIASHQHRESEQVAIFASPRAGSGAGRDEIPRVVERLQEDGIQVRTCTTIGDLHRWCADQNHPKSMRSKSTIIAAGGDGTITLAASVMLQHTASVDASDDQRQTPCLLPMPLGTENLLAKHFCHQATVAAVHDAISRGKRKSVDMGMVHQIVDSTFTNGRSSRSVKRRAVVKPMLTMVSCGFDADVVRQVHLRRKGHIKRSTYFGPILHAMRNYGFPKLKVELFEEDGSLVHQLCGGWVMVFNLPRYAGGLNIEPDAIGDDGWLDVIVFQGQNWSTGLKYLACIQLGKHLRHPEVQRVKAKRIRIRSDQRVHFQIDGDYAGRLPIEIAVRPRAVDFLIPPND